MTTATTRNPADFEAAIPSVEVDDETRAANVKAMGKQRIVRDDGTKEGFQTDQRKLRVAGLRNELGGLLRERRDDPAREATRVRRIDEVVDELRLYAEDGEIDDLDLDHLDVTPKRKAPRGRGRSSSAGTDAKVEADADAKAKADADAKAKADAAAAAAAAQS